MTHTRDFLYTKEELWDYYTYDNGILKHRRTRGGAFKEHPVGWSTPNGYIKTELNGRKLFVHRIIWVMFNGDISSKLVIDHINRNKKDNRIENLALVTNSENCQNSGAKGYTYVKNTGKYVATIGLGSFETSEEAREAYTNAKAIIHTYYRRIKEKEGDEEK